MSNERIAKKQHIQQSDSFDNATRIDDWFMRDAEKFSRLKDQLEAFLLIAEKVGSNANIEGVLKIICDKTTQLMRCERTTIFIVENDINGEQWLSSIIAEKSGVIRLRFGQGIAGNVAHTRKSLNIRDVYQSSLFDPSFDQKTGFRTRSCLAMPILNVQNDLLGVVQVINKLNGDFSADEDEEILASICSQIGVSLTQHRFIMSLRHKNEELDDARQKLQQKYAELDILYALEREAAAALDLSSLADRMLAKCMSAFRVDCAALLITDKNNLLFCLKADDACRQTKPIKLPLLIGQAIQTGECTRVTLRENTTLPEFTAQFFEIPLNALLIAPLCHQENKRGALILGSQNITPGFFSPSDAKLAAIFAANIAHAVSTHLDREENEKNARLNAIGQMFSGLMHDMKTPLANIEGYLDLMVSQDKAESREQFAEVITRQIQTIRSMGTEVLQFSRGETTLLLRKLPLHNVIKNALEILTPMAEKRGIRISCKEKFNGKIYYDEIKMQRVLLNLVKNAIEAIGRDGNIEISTRADETHVFLNIQDDGPGIPPEIARTLFDAFVTSGKENGTGLGLSIVRKIIDEHRATIAWKPVEPHGTSFIITFLIS